VKGCARSGRLGASPLDRAPLVTLRPKAASKKMATMDRDDPAYMGQAGYNPVMLAIYDPWVIGFMSRAVWHVPIHAVIDRYRRNIGRRHLDVGPGTGYCIDEADPPEETEITLLDPNRHVLRKAGARLARWAPVTVEADVMKPLPVSGPFHSAALSFVLHCLRGPSENKAIAIRNVADVLVPDGVLFGGTVLGLDARHSAAARAFLRAVNRRGDFDNLEDTAEGLRAILSASFRDVDVETVGSAALFTARRPLSWSAIEGPDGSAGV
jgi:SAM-dependent methyltransferase